MANPVEPSFRDLWREITTTEEPDLDTFFARVWKNGIWGLVGPDFSAAWDSNLPRFKEQIAPLTNGRGTPMSEYQWKCNLSIWVSFRIPTDEEVDAKIDFSKHEEVSLSLEPGRWKDALQTDPETMPGQWVGAGQSHTNLVFGRMFEALNARAKTMGLHPFPDGLVAEMIGERGYWKYKGRGYWRQRLDPNFPLNKIISDVSTHAICYDRIDVDFRMALSATHGEEEYHNRVLLALPEDYRQPWEASWRTTAQRHALHARIQRLQDLMAKASSEYNEAQMQSAVSADRLMPELGRMCRDMKDIADEIPGFIQSDALYPVSANYPLIRRRLLDVQDAYDQVARMCERPERWSITTFPMLAQQFGQDMKGVTRRTQTQRAELERARVQTEREEIQRMEKDRASRSRIKSVSPANRTKPMLTRKRARQAAEAAELQSPSKRSKTGEKDDDDDMMDTTP